MPVIRFVLGRSTNLHTVLSCLLSFLGSVVYPWLCIFIHRFDQRGDSRSLTSIRRSRTQSEGAGQEVYWWAAQSAWLQTVGEMIISILIRLAVKAVGQDDHHAAKINFLHGCDPSFRGKSLVDLSLCGQRGRIGLTKTVLKLIFSVHDSCILSKQTLLVPLLQNKGRILQCVLQYSHIIVCI